MKANWYCLSIEWTLYILWRQFENHLDKLIKPYWNQCGFGFWLHLLGNSFVWKLLHFLAPELRSTDNYLFTQDFTIQNFQFEFNSCTCFGDEFHIMNYIQKWFDLLMIFLKLNFSDVCICIQILGQSGRNRIILSCWLILIFFGK